MVQVLLRIEFVSATHVRFVAANGCRGVWYELPIAAFKKHVQQSHVRVLENSHAL